MANLPAEPVRKIPAREVLRMLLNTARIRISAEKAPKADVQPVPSPMVRRLHTQYRYYTKGVRRLERALAKRGFRNGYNGQLTSTNSEENRLVAQWEAGRAKRLATIRDWHVQALLDLVELPPAQVRPYLITLQKKLQAL